MKRRRRREAPAGVAKRSTRKPRARTSSSSDPDRINDLLRSCLAKVCELQQDLARQDDYEEDPQAAGYAACAIEALKFLSGEGLPADHPMVKVLTDRLLGEQERR